MVTPFPWCVIISGLTVLQRSLRHFIWRLLIRQSLLVLLYRLLRDFYCFVHRAVETSAGGIEMSPAVKEFLCHFVAGEIVHRAEADPYRVVLLGVFAKRDAETQPFDLQRHVHQSFCITLDIMEALEVFAS